MNFLQIAGRDIKTIFKNRLIRVSVIAIIIVPLLYSLLYLDAFWDPYSKLENMPVAVVNLDKGTELDGEKVNYGEGVVDNLRDNNTVGWKFVSQEEANRGLEGNDYYAIFLITDNFSEKVVSAKNGAPQTAGLKFICNEKKNFLAAQVNSKVQSALKEKIVSTITNNYVKVAFDSLYESKDGFEKAADGSKQITDGLDTLNGKVPELVDGVKQLNDGSIELYDGQVRLNNGLAELNGKVPVISNGAPLLYNGSSELAKGTTDAKNGSANLAYGTHSLYNAYTNQIYPSVQKLTKGANDLATGVSAEDPKIAALTAGSNQLIQSKALIDGGSTSIKTNYNTVAAGINQYITASAGSSKSISDNLTVALTSDEATRKAIIQGIISQINASSDPTSETAKKTSELVKGVNDLNTGIGAFDTKLKGYTSGVNGLANGTNELVTKVQAGTSQLNVGLNQFQTGLSSEIEPGLKKLDYGSLALYAGLYRLNDGSHTLNSKLEELNAKVPELSSGASNLYNGSKELLAGQEKSKNGLNKLNGKVPDLKDGVIKLYDGSSELTKALQEGSNKLGDGLINSSQDMADFVSAPVEMKIDPINPVPDYGTGFSPYFMNLSLWIGAIMMFFVISPKTDEYQGVSRIHKALGKFFSYAFIGVMQAVLVGVAVLLLGLAPENLGLYFAMLIFCSLVYVAIIQFLISMFGDAGRLLSIVLLILQLTACAGTFPLELVPGLFKVLNPFMPFTYAVEAFREICSASVIDYSIILYDVSILGIFLGVFLAGSIVFKHVGDKIIEVIEGKKEEAFEK